jgi:YHS domain-containing protein
MLRALLLALVAWSLVRFLLRLFRASPPAPGPPRSGNEAPSAGILIQDKVCGTFIEQRAALTAMNRQGEKAYFCSEACLQIWRQNRP